MERKKSEESPSRHTQATVVAHGPTVTEPARPICEIAKDGTVWRPIQPGLRTGRAQSQNVLHMRAATLMTLGVHNGMYVDVEDLWSKERGLPFFSTTMSQNRFREIMRYQKDTRRIRLSQDRFAMGKEKNVCILSSMHTSMEIRDNARKTPETVHYYSRTKVGADVLDEMLRQYC
ncbi:piggyBac transposable element-derived protein 4-like isoform X2 [Lates japonicus]|uniref:PiggyBac transposable element-derived protein 4-like isoform X2 n=1 Tax=Lates japonicus TaxID=270547 RepID=A0AAD3MYB4_LATJO|nr:piggyBac transposable element-derived protein 4-like isoform X2 [Lates japonicus]